MKRGLAGIMCLMLAPALQAADVRLDALRVQQGSGNLLFSLELSEEAQIKAFSLAGPDRFVVDITDGQRKGRLPKIDLSGTPVQGLRWGNPSPGQLRLVLDLQQAVNGKAYIKPGKLPQLVIELPVAPPVPGSAAVVAKMPMSAVPSPARKTEVVVAEAKPIQKAEPKPEPKAEQKIERREPVATAAQTVETKPASKADGKAEVKSEAKPERKQEPAVARGRDLVIAIDAGHGGVDSGAKGYTGVLEKDVVLAVARRLAALLEKEEGMRPVLIRDNDTFISLRQRTQKAKAAQADLFISIHADAFDDPRARGSSVFALSERGATTEAARVLANRENAADLVGGVSLDDKDHMLASVLLDLSQSATIEASLDVGARVLKGLDRLGDLHKRRVEQAGFVVLKSPDIPSILVETAFISNPDEEKRLNTPEYQQQLAESIMDGVRSYFHANPPPGTRIALARREAAEQQREHVAAEGETLASIAQLYRVSVNRLRAVNRLGGSRLSAGQVIQIPTGG